MVKSRCCSKCLSKLVSLEKPKFIPWVEKTCVGPSPCEEENNVIKSGLHSIGNRPRPFTDRPRLDNAYEYSNHVNDIP